jgi:hypothetical protein
MDSAAGHEGPGGLTFGDAVKSLAAFEGPSGFTIPSSQRSLIALAPRSCRSALWANALEFIPADCLDYAPRFSAERTKPSILQIPRRLQDFYRDRLRWFDSVAAGIPLRFGIQKRPKFRQCLFPLLPTFGQQITERSLRKSDPSSELAKRAS